MSLTLSETQSTFELPPAGPVAARCLAVIDLGTQETVYQGETKRSHKLLLTWELAELRSDGTPHRVSRRMTASLNPKSQLRPFLESWRGKAFSQEELQAFEVPKLLKAPCLLNLAHVERAGREYCNILAISPLPKGMSAPELVGIPQVFDLSKPDWETFDSLSERLQEQIAESPEGRAAIAKRHTAAPGVPSTPAADDFGDDIPF